MEKSRNMGKILIVDHSKGNRFTLSDILGHEFEVLEAGDSTEAIAMLQEMGTEISLVLMNIAMPKRDGFVVLDAMNKQHWIEDIPVLMISADSEAAHMEKAYELGVSDYICRPFRSNVVYRRVINTIMLCAKQKKMIGLVSDQIYEKEKLNNLMVTILNHMVEFRSGESVPHALRVQRLTEMLLECLVNKTSWYHITKSDIAMISAVSALHDIGKIGIPDEILNKPGKLTEEEFEAMKTHSMIGACMLERLPVYQNEPVVKLLYEICRWHHERYDGKGYPDQLEGNEIPIYVQTIGLADAYDSLTRDRADRDAYTHEEALKMIMGGECGAFNPSLLECLGDISNDISENMKAEELIDNSRKMRNIVNELLRHKELSTSERMTQMLEYEREKFQFFTDMDQEILFEYTVEPPMVTVSRDGAKRLGVDEITMNPHKTPQTRRSLGTENMKNLLDLIRKTDPEDSVIQYECKILIGEEARWKRIICRTVWSQEDVPRYLGVIGKVADIHEERTRMLELKHKAAHDGLTGLLNHENGKKRIIRQMREHPDREYAMMLFDMDYFKAANDTYGHLFGDHILEYLADKMRKSIRNDDIAARVGGDEFLIFMEYSPGFAAVTDRVFRSLKGKCESFPISISMGISKTTVVGRDYDALFHSADQALYMVKEQCRGQYAFYENVWKTGFPECRIEDSDIADKENEE